MKKEKLGMGEMEDKSEELHLLWKKKKSLHNLPEGCGRLCLNAF